MSPQIQKAAIEVAKMPHSSGLRTASFPAAEKLGLETTPMKPLCHYTSQNGLIGILKSKTMYATDATFLNDSEEVVYALNLAEKYFTDQRHRAPGFVMQINTILEQAKSLIEELPIYVASFSEEPDLLSQWRGYCPSGPGFAMCFTADRMTRIARAHKWSFYKCIYDVDRQIELIKRIEEHAESCFPEHPFPLQCLFSYSLLYFATVLKHPRFKEESEWRAIQRSGGAPSVRPGASTLVPYIPFPLTVKEEPVELAGLVVGPTSHPALAVRAAKNLLDENKVICPEPCASEIPFRPNW